MAESPGHETWDEKSLPSAEKRGTGAASFPWRTEFKLGPRRRVALPGELRRGKGRHATEPPIDDRRKETEPANFQRIPAGERRRGDLGIDLPAIGHESAFDRHRADRQIGGEFARSGNHGRDGDRPVGTAASARRQKRKPAAVAARSMALSCRPGGDPEMEAVAVLGAGRLAPPRWPHALGYGPYRQPLFIPCQR